MGLDAKRSGWVGTSSRPTPPTPPTDVYSVQHTRLPVSLGGHFPPAGTPPSPDRAVWPSGHSPIGTSTREQEPDPGGYVKYRGNPPLFNEEFHVWGQMAPQPDLGRGRFFVPRATLIPNPRFPVRRLSPTAVYRQPPGRHPSFPEVGRPRIRAPIRPPVVAPRLKCGPAARGWRVTPDGRMPERKGLATPEGVASPRGVGWRRCVSPNDPPIKDTSVSFISTSHPSRHPAFRRRAWQAHPRASLPPRLPW